MSVEDPEISAMSQIASALEHLQVDAQTRVLDWAWRRFNLESQYGSARWSVGERLTMPRGDNVDDHELNHGDFQEFVDLFDAAGPQTNAERALVGGYWFQVAQGQPDFPSQSVNSALKDVGQGIENITEAFSTLQERRPALVRQVAKSGRTRQARKKYKLTTAGAAAVREMLAGSSGAGEES